MPSFRAPYERLHQGSVMCTHIRSTGMRKGFVRDVGLLSSGAPIGLGLKAFPGGLGYDVLHLGAAAFLDCSGLADSVS